MASSAAPIESFWTRLDALAGRGETGSCELSSEEEDSDERDSSLTP